MHRVNIQLPAQIISYPASAAHLQLNQRAPPPGRTALLVPAHSVQWRVPTTTAG